MFLSLKTPFYYIACLFVFFFGGLFQPGEWYEGLTRAPWNPPNIVFPIAWTALYTLIAIAGHQASKSRDVRLISIWWAQLLVNASWSWVFFHQHWVLVGLIILITLLFLIGWFIVRSYKQSLTLPALLMTPYLFWVCLACSLNLYIYLYN